ncbi:MAG: Hsp33 family molecular chaperone [Pseudomonadota bacterium]
MSSVTVAEVGDDSVRPFQVEGLDVRGRAVSLGSSLDEILQKHDYPEPVARLLGEAILLTTLFGTSLKHESRFIFQTNTNGPVSLIVVDYRAPGDLRGYARFDAEAVAAAVKADEPSLLGTGHLAMTIDQGSDMDRYQGIVALEGTTLEEAVHQYFAQSEQLPTRIRIAVAEMVSRSDTGSARSRWRGGAVMVQFLPDKPERLRTRDLPGGDNPNAGEGVEAEDAFAEDDAWFEARSIAETIEDHELTDPEIGPDRLLYRLFHERGVRVFESKPIRHNCRCSRDKIRTVIEQFPAAERQDMVQDGHIVVTCEFCNSVYRFAPSEFDAADG